MINGAYVLASNKINLENYLDKDIYNFKKLFSKTGIRYVHRSNNYENTYSLAVKAVNKLKKKLDQKIENIIFVSQSSVSQIPSVGSLLQKKLNISKNSFTLDIVQGCSGFPYALIIASNLIENKIINNCLIICSETYTKYINKKNKVCFPIFSDGASAFFLNKKKIPKILSTIFMTDGAGSKNLCLINKNKKQQLFMNGGDVFSFTSHNVPLATNVLLDKANLKIKDIKLFIFHQASRIVLETIKNKLEIPEKFFFNNIKNIGNTVSSTIPIALIDADKQRKLPKNEPVLIMGFGVGYSLSGGIFIFK